MKLKAFTLMELLVGMTLTAILSVVAFSSYLLIQKQFFIIQKTQNTSYKYQEAYKVFSDDFRQAKWIEKTENQLTLTLREGAVYYDIWNKGISRYHSSIPEIKDTFLLEQEHIEYSFESESIDNGLIDKISIELKIFEEAQRLSIQKVYSSATLINYTEHEY